MPNHVTNILTIKSDDMTLIQKIRQEIQNPEPNDEGHHYPIDFNQINPIPKELEGTRSPAKIVSQKEYDEQEARIASGELTESEKKYGVDRGITKEIEQELLQKYGYADWYGWQSNNWGTKWNAYSQHEISGNVIKFETAWSTPFPLMKAMSEKYPEVIINVRYADEDFGHNVGEYSLKAGIIVLKNQPEGGSKEAVKMAVEIQQDEYYITDYLNDIMEENTDPDTGEVDEDEIENSTYFQGIAESAVGHPEIITYIKDDVFAPGVLKQLEKISVATENFEIAQAIKEKLDS